MRKCNEPNWEQRRYEIAKDVMCAMLSNPELVDVANLKFIQWKWRINL